MAEIFLALENGPRGFERVIVLKRVLAELCKSAELVQMFLDEAKLAALLDHPNVVKTFDLGVVRGRYYLAMEYLAGEDLGAILQQARKGKIALSPEMVAEIQIGVADGLHYAHEMHGIDGRPLHIVHRDVSPSNVIVTYRGESKLVDFGIARAESNVSKTAVGTLKGKVQYLAPEQVRGTAVDRRADLFAFGALMHELLTGVRLFRRENDLATLNAITREDIPWPSAVREDIPDELDRIVMKCLARNTAQRYQTAADVSADLRAFIGRSDAPRQDVALFLRQLFGEERRSRKVGVSQGSLDGAAKGHTPSWQLVRSGDVSPISGAARPVPARETPSRATPNTVRNQRAGSHPRMVAARTPAPSTPARELAPLEPPTVEPKLDPLDNVGAEEPVDAPPAAEEGSSIGLFVGVAFLAFVLVGAVAVLAIRGRSHPAAAMPDDAPTSQGGGLASLRLEGLPDNAKVRVDGSLVSDPRGEIYLPPGTHRLQAEAAGLAPYDVELALKGGEVRAVKIPLQPPGR
jgi:serine/threonine protein kinase